MLLYMCDSPIRIRHKTATPLNGKYTDDLSDTLFRFSLCKYSTNQRESLGLLEYQAIPLLHDVAHDGWLCTLTVLYCITTAENFPQLAAGQPLSGQPVLYGKGRRYGPSLTCTITPAGSLSSSQPGGPPCWTCPLTFGLIGTN
jgi:hypothetical protein